MIKTASSVKITKDTKINEPKLDLKKVVTSKVPQLPPPNVYYQVNTRNITFLKLHKILKDKGIKNNAFFLQLYDKELLYIDPHSKSLTPQQENRVLLECQRNFWYYLREVVRVPASGASIPYRLHRGNLALSWALLNDLSVFHILPRQTGKTMGALIFYAWAYDFGSRYSKFMFTHKVKSGATDNLKLIKDIRDELPPYLQMFDPKNDTDNIEIIRHDENNNEITCVAPSKSEVEADKKGRGRTENIHLFDEIAFIPNIRIMWAAAGPAYSTASENAKANGVPAHRLCITTPGDLSNPDGKWVHDDFESQCAPWTEKLYDMTLDQINNYIATESMNDFVHIEYGYRALGLSEEYFKKQCRILNNDQAAINREVLLQRARGSGMNPFGEEAVQRLFDSVKEPVGSITIKDFFFLKIFKSNFDPNIPYIIGGDTSGMTGSDKGDYTSLCVMDPRTFEVIATLKTNARNATANTAQFKNVVVEIMRDIFPKSILVMERNYLGIPILDQIYLDYPDLIPRLYSSSGETSAKGPKKYKDNDPAQYLFGFVTNSDTRARMFNEIMGVVVTEDYDILNDLDIVKEIANLVRKPNGRIDHRLGKHDDLLISYLIARHFATYSSQIHKYMNPSIIRSASVMVDDDIIQEREKELEERNKRLRELQNEKEIQVHRISHPTQTNQINFIGAQNMVTSENSIMNEEINTDLHNMRSMNIIGRKNHVREVDPEAIHNRVQEYSEDAEDKAEENALKRRVVGKDRTDRPSRTRVVRGRHNVNLQDRSKKRYINNILNM